MEHFQFRSFTSCLRMFVLIASILSALYLLSLAPQKKIDKAALISLSVLIFTLGLWITEYLPMAVSGFIGCFLLYSFGRFYNYDILVNNSFAGFANSSVWFVFSGLIIGAAMEVSGLARRISLIFLSLTKSSYSKLILGFLLISAILVFLIPSTDARTVTLMSLVVGMSGFHAEEEEKNLMKGLSILVPISSGVMGVGVLASVTSITAVGFIEQYLSFQISYLRWLILFLPAEVLSMITLYFLITRIFPCHLEEVSTGDYVEQELKKLGAFSPVEKKTALIIGGAVLLWLTGFLTSLRPDIIAMACASVLLLPRFGVIEKKDLRTKVNWLIAPIFLGTAFSIVDCLDATGILKQMGNFLLNSFINPFQSEGYYTKMLAVSGLSGGMHLLTAHSSMLIASFLPIILQWTSSLHLGIGIPLMFIWGSQFELLIYQSSSLTVAFGYGAFKGSDLLKIAFPLIIIDFFGGDLLLYGWWKVLGVI